mmetsp:Transcript_71421/g.232070  ORF Transcript_71421/g.232070 Transcript_71421/m.232070 type:complete len:285 (+) Transcript_71421:103-957(+)
MSSDTWMVQPLRWGGAIRFAGTGSGPMPSGCRLWAAALALVGALRRLPEAAVAGRCVIELGAGCGLPGVSALPLGCRELVLSDSDEAALWLLRGNLQRCATPSAQICPPEPMVSAIQLDFCDAMAVQRVVEMPGGQCPRLFDVVLASEFVYESGVLQRFVAGVAILLAPGGLALAANRDRPLAGPKLREQLRDEAAHHSLVVQILPAEDAARLFAEGLAHSGLSQDDVSGSVDPNTFLALITRADRASSTITAHQLLAFLTSTSTLPPSAASDATLVVNLNAMD